MKIIYLANLFSFSSGSEYLFWIYAKYMALKGYDITVLCYKAENDALRKVEYLLRNDMLKVYELCPNLEHRGVLFTDIISNLLYIKRGSIILEKILSKEKDVIVHSNPYMPVLLGLLVKNTSNSDFSHILSIYDVASSEGLKFIYKWFRETSNSIVAGMKSLVARAYENLILNMTYDGIIVLSLATLNDLRKLSTVNRNNIFMVPGTIDPSLYDEKYVNNISYEPIVLYIGRLVWYKNLETLLLAFREVSKEHKDAKLVIIGDGPSRERLERLTVRLGLRNNVNFLGKAPESTKDYWLSRARVVVNPSIYEGFGLTILEAWLFKKPVIVSNVKPLADLVENSKTGLLFNNHDHRNLAEKLTSLLVDEGSSERMGMRGRQVFETKYSPNKIAIMLEKLYHKVSA